MELSPIMKSMCKKQIVDMFVATRKGVKTEDEFQKKFDEVLDYAYNCGVEMGLSDALNYVENAGDRERIFDRLADFAEEVDNGN